MDEVDLSSKSYTKRVDKNKANGSGRRGMVLPFEPLSLTFDDIRYSVDMPQVHYLFLRYTYDLN